MEQIINYRDIPTDKRLDILNALERIGFFPAYGGVKTMQQIMEKSVPGSGPQFYFVFRENELIGQSQILSSDNLLSFCASSMITVPIRSMASTHFRNSISEHSDS